MRNQLLRDADWAGMAHVVEIRVPFADTALLRNACPGHAGDGGGAGKLALAQAPARSLPDAVVARAKTGFAVPTGAWIECRRNRLRTPNVERAGSRRWSRMVLDSCGA